jgi:hypothetical protein
MLVLWSRGAGIARFVQGRIQPGQPSQPDGRFVIEAM